MRCKQCEYRLWNLTSRVCPECGTPFLPSEFSFIPNSVQYCCPHCDQSYYGTGEQGHLVPRRFTCVSCGSVVDMDEMVLRPTAGLEEEQTAVDKMPWLERAKIGRVRAWFATIGMALIKPGRLIRTVPVGQDSASPWGFALLTNLLVYLAALSVFMIIPLIALMSVGRPGAFGACGFIGGMLASIAVTLIALVIHLCLWGLITHALLCLTGRTAHTMARTFQALGFSTGANVFSAIPCFGLYFGWIWWVVSAVIMVREGQQVSGGRAALAVLAWPVLLIVGLIGLYAVAIYFSLTTAATMSTTMGPAGVTMQTVGGTPPFADEAVVTSVLEYANDHADAGPGHALDLVAGGYLESDDLIALQTETYVDDVSVAGFTLADFEDADAPERARMLQAARATLPDDVIAHRLGDWVFCYHGIDLEDPPAHLWLVILSPDPDSNDAVSVDGWYATGQTRGDLLYVPASGFAAALEAQNMVRTRHGLPPLPDPREVTHTRPATAGS